ncbi:MAG: hypothetical protein AAFS10_19345 [Myxococcota bacterium]
MTRTRSPGLWLLGLVLLATVGCSYSVHVHHTSDVRFQQPLSTYTVVESTGEQFTFLGMVGQTDYVDRAFADLQSQCPGGHITGIQTRYSTSHGFFSWTNKVVMKGYCSQGSAKGNGPTASTVEPASMGRAGGAP